jgi:hypothetical protein
MRDRAIQFKAKISHLHSLFDSGNYGGLIAALRADSNSCFWRNDSGEMIIHKVARSGNVQLMNSVLGFYTKEAINAEIYVNQEVITPMHYAVQSGSQKMVDELVKNGANIADLVVPSSLENGIKSLQRYSISSEMYSYLESGSFKSFVNFYSGGKQAIKSSAEVDDFARKKSLPKSLVKPVALGQRKITNFFGRAGGQARVAEVVDLTRSDSDVSLNEVGVLSNTNQFASLVRLNQSSFSGGSTSAPNSGSPDSLEGSSKSSSSKDFEVTTSSSSSSSSSKNTASPTYSSSPESLGVSSKSSSSTDVEVTSSSSSRKIPSPPYYSSSDSSTEQRKASPVKRNMSSREANYTSGSSSDDEGKPKAKQSTELNIKRWENKEKERRENQKSNDMER